MANQIAQVLEGALRQPDQTDQESIRVDTPAWWRWLEAETTRSFAFRETMAKTGRLALSSSEEMRADLENVRKGSAQKCDR